MINIIKKLINENNIDYKYIMLCREYNVKDLDYRDKVDNLIQYSYLHKVLSCFLLSKNFFGNDFLNRVLLLQVFKLDSYKDLYERLEIILDANKLLGD